MKKFLGIAIAMALIVGFSGDAMARSVKKNAPKKKDVVSHMRELGPPHYPRRMKVSDIGPIKTGDTYYHAFSGDLGNGTYHIIIYDNNLNYLGFYETEFEAEDYEEGAILLNSPDGDSYYRIPIPETGPKEKVLMENGMPLILVKAPGAEEGADKASAEKSSTTTAGDKDKDSKDSDKAKIKKENLEPQYRDWTITYKGRKLKVRALFVERKGGKVFLKAEANGKTKSFLYSQLSKADQEYVRKFKFKPKPKK
jgi:hypothetical protein